MKKVSTTHTPSGILGVFTIPDEPAQDTLTPGLVLAKISDPGNMGTLIRTAAACNLKSVVLIEGCDPWSPKVLQAAVGTNATLQIFRWSWEELLQRKRELKLYGLVVRDGKPPLTLEASQALLVIGNEARGIEKEWLKDCDELITLPMPGSTESLNAAVAGSIAAYLTFAQL